MMKSVLSDNPDAVAWNKDQALMMSGGTHSRPRGLLPETDAEIETAVETAERLLGIGEDSHDLAWVHDQVSYYFATRNPTDTEFYATNHPKSGQSRYNWTDLGGGVRAGWLKDE